MDNEQQKQINWDLWRWQALKAVGLLGHPKADEAYALAWETGGQGGPDEVLVHLADIAEIILEKV